MWVGSIGVNRQRMSMAIESKRRRRLGNGQDEPVGALVRAQSTMRVRERVAKMHFAGQSRSVFKHREESWIGGV